MRFLRGPWRYLAGVALLVAVLGGVRGAPLAADEPTAGAHAALARGLEALKVRLEGKRLEAELLARAGRTDEALAVLRDLDRLYRDGVSDLERLVAAAGARAAPAAQPPLVVPPGANPPSWEDPESQAGGGDAFRGRGGRKTDRPGGSKPREDAVLHALRWLAAHQSPDGGWEAAGFETWCDHKPNAGERPDGPGKAVYDTGVTGLALCAFLGAGYTNRGEHEFAKVVRDGLQYLKNVQDPEGCFGPRTTQHYIYNHACAALAMVEAYGMTESTLYRPAAQKALDFIALARNPYFVWRYGVKPGDNDSSVTGWMMMALKSAKLINEDAAKRGKPLPLTIDEEAFDGVRAWFDKLTDPDYGRVGYIHRGGGPARPQEMVDRFPAEKSESMTSVGVLARILVGDDPRTDPRIRKGADLLAKLPPAWNPHDGSIDMYYWYYGTLALFQVGGEHWSAWSAALDRAVVPQQRRDGNYCAFKGSWDPVDPWGPDGGRVYATALLAMCLEVHYRYERVFGIR
jgi:hypothetical protein